ncbi:MAG: hypothetical protein EXS43_14245 [Opitutus sp.]|nr:hypothetical protein [Opitutus sp.]
MPTTALRTGMVLALGVTFSAVLPQAWSRDEAAPLAVCLLSEAGTGSTETAAAVGRLESYLVKDLPGKYRRVCRVPLPNVTGPPFARPSDPHVAVLFDQQETLTAEGLDLARGFVARGKGLVVLRSRTGASEAWKKFQDEVLGVRYAGPLPRDARLTSLSLYPHPIFTAETDRFETREELLRATVKDDAVIIIEGEVGEFSVPMAWLRSYRRGRVFGLMPGEAALFHDPAYLKIMANAIRAGRWPVHSRRPHGRSAHLYGGRPPGRFRDHVSGRAGRVLRSRSRRSRLRLDGRRRGRPPLVHGAARRGHEGVCRPFVRGNFLPRGSHPGPARRHVDPAALPLNRFPRSFRQCAVAHP